MVLIARKSNMCLEDSQLAYFNSSLIFLNGFFWLWDSDIIKVLNCISILSELSNLNQIEREN